MVKRTIIRAYDAAAAVVVACLLSAGVPRAAFAYIDPSVMTYTIQALAGVAVALSAVAGVALRRGRKALMRMLDIDENGKRQREPDVHRTVQGPAMQVEQARQIGQPPSCAPEAQAPPLQAQAPADGPVERGLLDDRAFAPRWRERLLYGFLAAFFLVFTVYYVAPLEIVGGASADLVYSLADVWWVPLLPDLGIIAVLALLLSALRGRAHAVGLAVVFGLGLGAYAQALFLNWGLPAADGNTIVWLDYLPQQLVSAAVWACLIAGAVLFCLHNLRRGRGAIALLSVALVVVQGVGLVGLAATLAADDGSSSPGGKVVMTEDQLFTVNPDHNVIVFVLDTYDNAYLNRVLKMNPALLDGLTGFTYYDNATSATIPTRFAIPEMLTGQMPSFDESYSTYTRERYARGDFLQNIYDAGYSIGLYTDSLRISALPAAEQYEVTSKTVNMHDLPDSTMDYGGALYTLYQMGQYRDVPWSFKSLFWYYTDQVNQAMVASDESLPPDETVYIMDDVRYYNRLCDFGLTLEDGDNAGAFRFIHLLGSHYPFNYDEEANYLGEDESDVFRQSQGAIHIVTTYVNELKRLGVYENTTIVITADHGYWTITLDPIEETSTPIMFVKGEQSAEADARPLVTDSGKPVSHLDLQATVLDAMGLDYSDYADRGEWSGYSMFDSINPARVRHYLTTDSEPDLTEVQFREYVIDGYAQDWSNWAETGRTIDAQE